MRKKKNIEMGESGWRKKVIKKKNMRKVERGGKKTRKEKNRGRGYFS